MAPMRFYACFDSTLIKKCTNNLRQYFHNFLSIKKTKPPAEQGVIFTLSTVYQSSSAKYLIVLTIWEV